jgi:dTDP-4-amino-4,6-dideoxygalactose transaminase
MKKMNIPLLDLKAQYRNIQEEINQKIQEVLTSQRFVLGPEVEALETEIADYCGVKYAVGVSSGSDALLVSLMALEIGEGDEVVTTPFTFFATAGAIARLKAKPIFCDIERKSCNLSPDKLKELFGKQSKEKDLTKIKAVVPVHLYGQVADMDPIMDLSREYGFIVVEDAAQAIGAEYPSRIGVKTACSIGDIGILSFFPSKNLGAYGDGGMVLTNNEVLAAKLKVLRMHGSRDKYFYEILGGNFRLDALQAGILRVKLSYLDTWKEARKAKAQYFDKAFKESGFLVDGCIQIPEPLYKNSAVTSYHAYHQYVVRAQKRDSLRNFLKEKGVGTSIYYPLPLHMQKCFSHLGYQKGDFPESELAAQEVLALPIYPELTSDQQDYIVASIGLFYKS